MPINVVFTRAGFHHPAYGRMGMGKNVGRIYRLPDIFAEEGMLPKSVTILTVKGEKGPKIWKGYNVETISDEELDDRLAEYGETRPTKPAVGDETKLKEAEKKAAEAKKRSAAAAKKRAEKAKLKADAEAVDEADEEEDEDDEDEDEDDGTDEEPETTPRRGRRRSVK